MTTKETSVNKSKSLSKKGESLYILLRTKASKYEIFLIYIVPYSDCMQRFSGNIPEIRYVFGTLSSIYD